MPLGVGTRKHALKDIYKDKISQNYLFIEKVIKELNLILQILLLFKLYMNSKLSLKIAKIAKEVNPKILTVMGGPHCESDNEGMKEFLKKYPQMNSYIPFEGESPIIELIGKMFRN